MKLTKPQIQSLSSGIRIRKNINVISIQTIDWKIRNHEMWWQCQDCGTCTDVKKELEIICPKCGSKNLK